MTIKVERPEERIINIGEPVRPGSDFYPTAQAYRSALDRLNLRQTEVMREILAPLTVELEAVANKIRRGVVSLHIKVAIEVEYEDGTVEEFSEAGKGRGKKRAG